MKHTEAILAVRHLAAYFPNQKFDEFTADAWADALTRYEYPDAMDVIKRVATAPLRQGQSFLLEAGKGREGEEGFETVRIRPLLAGDAW